MKASEALIQLMRESGRKAVLRKELLKRANSSPSTCDRVLKHGCNDGKLVRVGHGVYGIGDAKIFEIVPEVMPKLGYQIQPVLRVKGFSQKSSGRVWRLDRKCKRKIRKQGVFAVFEDEHGNLSNVWERKEILGPPTAREIEDRFHSSRHCHSHARAEKNLVVHRALEVFEKFKDERAVLAIEGGTALAHYYRLIDRCTEDMSVRIVLHRQYNSLQTEERVAILKEIGVLFRDHVLQSMPFLTFTKKGRIRKDGVIQSLIFEYPSAAPHDEVVAGLKVELVCTPVSSQLGTRTRTGKHKTPVVRLLDIAVGKWQALAIRLPRSGTSYPDLVRHVHDLAALAIVIEESSAAFRNIALKDSVTQESVVAVLNELRNTSWRTHYNDYMRRMGTTDIADEPGYHPTWEVVLADFGRTAHCLSAQD